MFFTRMLFLFVLFTLGQFITSMCSSWLKVTEAELFLTCSTSIRLPPISGITVFLKWFFETKLVGVYLKTGNFKGSVSFLVAFEGNYIICFCLWISATGVIQLGATFLFSGSDNFGLKALLFGFFKIKFVAGSSFAFDVLSYNRMCSDSTFWIDLCGSLRSDWLAEELFFTWLLCKAFYNWFRLGECLSFEN